MRFVTVWLVSPPAALRGYLSRFLHEPTPCLFVGGATVGVCDDLAAAVAQSGVVGFVAVSDPREEMGFEYRYYRVPGRRITRECGVPLVEKLRVVEVAETVDTSDASSG
ncbi:MAG TPA: type I-E CRISPR-associated endoribonuclease Cas2 [Nevskiaceae bacterium]|nr:type I-E CRISPR-associated endoribonuclease Cas2 [Nevskiaceae bacterium]